MAALNRHLQDDDLTEEERKKLIYEINQVKIKFSHMT